jgi:hypothetical protein
MSDIPRWKIPPGYVDYHGAGLTDVYVEVVTYADAVRWRDEAVAAAVLEVESKRLVQAIFHAPDDGAKPFVLQRITDVSGVSGTGVVAHGVEFPDGTVALRWVGGNPTSVVFHDNGMASVEAIHGHGGNTRIVWTYEDMGPRAAEMDECEARGFEQGVKAARDAVLMAAEAGDYLDMVDLADTLAAIDALETT